MRTKQTISLIRETFVVDLAGIFSIAGVTKSFFRHWTMITSLTLTVITMIGSYWLEMDILNLITEFKSLMLDFLPGILGFTIAGYSLMTGFIQAGALSKITEPTHDSNYSLYQRMSATFALNILLQAIALLIAYFVHFVIYVDNNENVGIRLPLSYVNLTNASGLLLLSYWFYVSLFMVIQIVLNIFGFSQLHHYFVNKEKVDSQQKNESADPTTMN